MVSCLGTTTFGSILTGAAVSRVEANPRPFNYEEYKRCMLTSSKPGADFSRGCARPAMRPPSSATYPHPASQKNRSPGNGTPARSGSRAGLPWAAIKLRVEVDYHPPSARAPLASHPRTTLHLVHAPLKASQAGAFLVGIPSLGDHDDHAISSSTSWSRRSSRLWMSASLPFLRAHSR